MKNTAISILLLMALGACSTQPKSAFESGWTANSNELTYNSCAIYRLNKDMPIQQNLDLIVSNGWLTQEQAARAASSDVRIGDPECLAYAAYGLQRSKIVLTSKEGVVIDKAVSYQCSNSNAPCPGVTVHFADGKVMALDALID